MTHPKPTQYCQASTKIGLKGSILMSVRAPVGKLNIADQNYGIGRGLCAIIPDPKLSDVKFVHYVLQVSLHLLLVLSTGSTYDSVSISDIDNLLLIFPSLDEQEAIARFLDHETNKIDRLIAIKRKTINLLNEQKSAIIQQAVTKGIDPDVPLKDSGIPWLGEIPQHWTTIRAKYLYREVDERSIDGSEELLSVSHITGVTPRSEKNITMFKAASYVGQKLCRQGDLVINTMWAWMGALAISKYFGIVSSSYGVYRPVSSNLLGIYANYLLRTPLYIKEYICCSTGIRSSRLRLYPEEFLKILILLPPVKEQQRIIEWIAKETLSANSAIAQAEKQITLLREYRTKLIADVVIGKLDVREAAKDLPEEIEEVILEDLSDIEEEVEDLDIE